MWSTLATWVKGEDTKIDTVFGGSKNRTQIIMESLSGEVMSEIRFKEKIEESVLEKSNTGANYGWLASKVTRNKYVLSDMEKYQLDMACAQVTPSMCNSVILTFRERSSQEENVAKIAHIMQTVIAEALTQEKKIVEEVEMKREFEKRAKMRRRSLPRVFMRESQNKVSPLAMSDCGSTYSIPTLSKTIEELPI